MKKQRKQLILLIIVLLLLVAGYFGVQKYNEVQSSKEQEEEAPEKVTDLTSSDITEISYNYEGQEYTFVYEEDTWKNKEDKTLNIKQTLLGTMATRLAQIESQAKIENVTDLSEYGLDEPAQVITFVAAGTTYKVSIGDYNDISSLYYLNLNDGNTVHGVSGTLKTAFSYSLEELIEEEEVVEESTEETVEETAEESTGESVESSEAATE